MSSEPASTDEFAAWTPGETLHQCANCGTPVSERFAAVFGDNSDTVHRCLECSTFGAISNGGGRGATTWRGEPDA